MQRIKTRLVPLRWRGPVHSNDTGIVSLMCSLGCPQRKTKIYCPIIEGANPSTFQRYPSAPKGATVTNTSAGSCSSPMVQKSCRRMLQRRNRKRRVRKYVTRSRLSNVTDRYYKSLLAQARINARTPFFSYQIQWTQPSFPWYNRLSAWLISPCTSV